MVRHLCSPACAGRLPNSAEGIAARARIVAEMEAAGLEPFGESGFIQDVPRCGANVLGVLRGNGPHRERSILVAAHYDHLGHGDDGEVYWGADDNAAAVAVLMEVARDLGLDRDRLGRKVIFAAFDGEEPPHFMQDSMGSMHYVRQPPEPVEQIDLMICMDLVGHALGPAEFPAEVRNSLFVLGAELSEGTGALVDAAGECTDGVVPRRLDLDVVPPLSDYFAFREAGVPVLFLTCGRWEHYHAPTDTPEKLDYPKIAATSVFLRELVVAASNRTEASVPLRTDARDDAATLASLLALGQRLASEVPDVATFLPLVEGLARKAEAGPLSAEERALIPQLVGGLETLLGG